MKKISILILIIGGFFFNKYGAKTEISFIDKENEISEEVNVQSRDSAENKKEVLNESTYYNKKLEIERNKCIGCGKCVVVAPNNFTINSNTRLAEVKSQSSINGVEVNRAIRVCPTRAISI